MQEIKKLREAGYATIGTVAAALKVIIAIKGFLKVRPTVPLILYFDAEKLLSLLTRSLLTTSTLPWMRAWRRF